MPISWVQLQKKGWVAGIAIGLVGFCAVVATLGDPGLTVDEPINVAHGARMVTLLFHDPQAFVNYQQGRPDHPPLTRMFIGLTHYLCFGPTDRGAIVILYGRLASAGAYAILLVLCTRMGYAIGGPLSGVGSGVALLLMPRLFAHAHLASPEIVSTCFCFAAVSATAWALRPNEQSRPVAGLARITVAGCVLGLALLTKLTAVLVPLTVLLALVSLQWHRSLAKLALWGSVGLIVFVLGWPWLWPLAERGGLLGTVDRITQFLSVGVERATIYTWYFGTQYPTATGRPVPWHYVWTYFFVTVPLLFQFVGLFAGVPRLWRQRGNIPHRLVLFTIAITLAFFSLPIAKYDGERLFLLVFPFWALCIGVGLASLYQWLTSPIGGKVAAIVVTTLVVCQAYGIVHYHPCQLSYHNLAVGGLKGAERLGLEISYWGDSLTEGFLDDFAKRAQQDDNAVLVPTLFAGHASLLSSPTLDSKQIRILPADDDAFEKSQWVIVFHRDSYLQDERSQRLLHGPPPVLQYAIDGVWLSRAYPVPRE